MATASTTPTAPAASKRASNSMMTWLPYAIGIGAQIPLLFFYFIKLWERGPHYHFFPLAIAAVVAIAWLRWPREERMPHHRSTWSDFLLIMGLGAGLLAAIFLEPWFAAASVILLITSLFARTVDPESGKGMWPVALPLYVALILPDNWDMVLITWLQRISAVFTSRLLDLIGMGHHMPGTVIQIPGKEAYGIEQACSGVMSFFTLLFVAMVFIVWNRRPWFRSLLLIVSAVFWALFMNTIRIFMIPFADRMTGIDLSDGTPHAILGYIVLVIGILLLLSTDQFLLFLFGPVESTTGRSGPFGNFLTRFWNGLVSGSAETDEESEKRKKRRGMRKPITAFGRTLMWIAAGLLAVGGLWQVVDTARSFGKLKLNADFFPSADVTEPFTKGDLKSIGQWDVVSDGYESVDRKKGSDLGLRSDSWPYRSKTGLTAIASFDQTFPGWHELTTCYRNQGWQMKSRIRRTATENDLKWPYIEATFEKDTGEQGYLLFAFFDAYGEPFDAPAEWGTLNSFFYKVQNRLNHRIRSRLFRGEAYQCQVWASSFGEYDELQKDEIQKHFLLLRDEMRTKFLAKREGSDVPSEPDDPDAPTEDTSADPVSTDPATTGG